MKNETNKIDPFSCRFDWLLVHRQLMYSVDEYSVYFKLPALKILVQKKKESKSNTKTVICSELKKMATPLKYECYCYIYRKVRFQVVIVTIFNQWVCNHGYFIWVLSFFQRFILQRGMRWRKHIFKKHRICWLISCLFIAHWVLCYVYCHCR